VETQERFIFVLPSRASPSAIKKYWMSRNSALIAKLYRWQQ
jgi:hypothetical protein